LIDGVQATGNSNAIRGAWQPLRQAGAAARTMLVSAAARRWNVDPASCRAQSGEVLHPSTGRCIEYGALAADAALALHTCVADSYHASVGARRSRGTAVIDPHSDACREHAGREVCGTASGQHRGKRAIFDASARRGCSTSPLCARQDAGSTFHRLAAADTSMVLAAAPAWRKGCHAPRIAFELPVACTPSIKGLP